MNGFFITWFAIIFFPLGISIQTIYFQIIEQFSAQPAAARQSVTGEVVPAITMDDATLKRLTAELSRTTGKNVQLFQKADPSILGGAIICIGDQVIDGSLRRKLNQLKDQLAH